MNVPKMPHGVARDGGFTLTELLISTTIMLLLAGAALTTFKNAVAINDSASELTDANQNLRAGTNELIRDLMMAGRIIGSGGIALPNGAGAAAFNRPAPTPQSFGNLSVLDDIETGYQLGPAVLGTPTDMVTIMMVDEFMPVIKTPPAVSGSPTTVEGTIAPDASSITLPNNSLWLAGDPIGGTGPIQVGDLIYFENPSGNAIQTVMRVDSTHIYFDANDWFNFNQRGVPQVPVFNMKTPQDQVSPWTVGTTLFRALMISYYVDNTTTPGTPRLDRVINHYTPQALAGVVENLNLTYDLVDGVYNPSNITSLPWFDSLHSLTYVPNQIRTINVTVGVRSEVLSKPAQDYVRNRITTAVDARSLSDVSRYVTQ